MSFDVASTSTLESSTEGVFMPFLNARTGDPLRDDDGKEVGVTLRGRLSRQGQQFQQDQATKRLEMGRRGQEVSVDTLESETTEMLVALTVGWSFDTLDEKPFPCSPENARKFWSDPRFRAHRERANVFVGNEANFTKR
jgi:hypothetical protein